MKSPLSFLARLMSRGRPPEPQQLLAAPDSEADAPKLETKAAPPVQSGEVETPITNPVDDRHEPEVTAETLVAEEPVMLQVAEERVTPEPEPTRTVRRKRAARSAKPVSGSEGTVAEEGSDDAAAAPISVPANDEASLDAEIAELRKKLSQKLRLQNAQLKKRLERFDRS